MDSLQIHFLQHHPPPPQINVEQSFKDHRLRSSVGVSAYQGCPLPWATRVHFPGAWTLCLGLSQGQTDQKEEAKVSRLGLPAPATTTTTPSRSGPSPAMSAQARSFQELQCPSLAQGQKSTPPCKAAGRSKRRCLLKCLLR